ncbi:MAG TPA: FkbM family methyltransferase [Methylocella sp.]|nr:FkbM family methyltransferase [Methylocella sp.]
MIKRQIFESLRAAAISRGFWVARAGKAEAASELVEVIKSARATAALRRFGAAGDGGYLLPDDLEGIAALFSPGVSTICEFDLEFAERGIDVYMADASVNAPPINHPKFHFSEKFIDTYISATTTTMSAWLEETGMAATSEDLVLQMDIECAEYRVFASIPDTILRRFRIIVVEIHNLDQIFSDFSAQTILGTFKRLSQFFNIVHIHPNNIDPLFKIGNFEVYPTMEFTLYRKDRPVSSGAASLPNPLDADCVVGKPTAVLPAIWTRLGAALGPATNLHYAAL